jgi:hypothetical protein
MVHTKSHAKKETGDACTAPHASACAPCSQSLRCTTPTARHTGQLTSTNPPARSRSPSLSGPHPATRSALTRHAGWNVCPHTDAPSPSERMTTRARSAVGSGSSSDGPSPQDTSSQRNPFSRSPCSTRWRRVKPGGGGGTHGRFGAAGPGGACGVVAVAVVGGGKPPNGADQNHDPSGIRTN